MAVTVDARNAGASSNGAATLSWTHTVGAALVNGVLVVIIGTATSAQQLATSVVWDSGGANTPLTRYDAQFSIDGFGTEEIWYLVNPAAGAKTILVTLPASANFGLAGASASYSGVDQTTTFRAAATKFSTSGLNISQAVPSAVGDIVVDGEINSSTVGGPPAAGGSQTAIGSANPGPGNFWTVSSDQAGSASVTMVWTFPGSTGNRAYLAGSLKAAVAGVALPASPRVVTQAVNRAANT
jgi:hypothetical protein